MLATSNMLADIAKGGHSLKKAAPIVKKVDPKMNLLNSIKKGSGGDGTSVPLRTRIVKTTI